MNQEIKKGMLIDLDLFTEDFELKVPQPAPFLEFEIGDEKEMKLTGDASGPYGQWSRVMYIANSMPGFFGVVFTGETNLLTAHVVNTILFRKAKIFRKDESGKLNDITNEFDFVGANLVELRGELPITRAELEAFEKRVIDEQEKTGSDLIKAVEEIGPYITTDIVRYAAEKDLLFFPIDIEEHRTLPARQLNVDVRLPLNILVDLNERLEREYNVSITREQNEELFKFFNEENNSRQISEFSSEEDIEQNFITLVRNMGFENQIPERRLYLKPIEVEKQENEEVGEEVKEEILKGMFVTSRDEVLSYPEIKFTLNGEGIEVDSLTQEFPSLREISLEDIDALVRYVWFSNRFGLYSAQNLEYSIRYEDNIMFIDVTEISVDVKEDEIVEGEEVDQ